MLSSDAGGATNRTVGCDSGTEASRDTDDGEPRSSTATIPTSRYCRRSEYEARVSGKKSNARRAQSGVVPGLWLWL